MRIFAIGIDCCTKPSSEKWGALCLSLPICRQNLHSVITNFGDLDHRTNSKMMTSSGNAVGPQVASRDLHITKESAMSRRGIHPLHMGRDRPQRVTPKHPVQTSGLESAQRKRYLRLEAEEAETLPPVEA